MTSIEGLDERHFDVVVIGAGVAGSMCGLLAARAGLNTLLLDRQKFPRHKVCGCCLNDRAVQMLRKNGLESSLHSLLPKSTNSLAVRYRGRKLDIPLPPNVAVSRFALDQRLVFEAVNSGCLFFDDVTAAVSPLPGDSEPSDARACQLSASGQPPERIVDLRLSGQSVREAAGATGRAREVDSRRVFAKVVLVCDGPGHPSLYRLSGFRASAAAGSRIGLGAVFPRTSADDWIKPGEILMAVAQHGYAGVVEIEGQQWDLAAAIDPLHLNQTKSPLLSLEQLFQSAGVPVPAELVHATIKGTLPLTRTAKRIAGHRLFLLGDATGYVEPFTGEGMAWALTAANAIVPLVIQAVRYDWSNELVTRWHSIFRAIVSREQKLCRVLSAALKHPWILPPVLTMCHLFPSLTRHLVSQINRVPEALEIP